MVTEGSSGMVSVQSFSPFVNHKGIPRLLFNLKRLLIIVRFPSLFACIAVRVVTGATRN